MKHSEQAYLRSFLKKIIFKYMYIIYRNSRNWVFFVLVKLLFYKTNSLCCLVLGVFYAKIWVPQKGYIDKRTCSNTCFDTIFRGL